MIGPVEAEEAGGEIEGRSVGSFDGAKAGVAVVRLGALVSKTQRVARVLLDGYGSIEFDLDDVVDAILRAVSASHHRQTVPTQRLR